MLTANGILLILVLCIISMFKSSLAQDATETIDQPLLCDGCIAVIAELHKKLNDSYGRKRLIEKALDDLCETDNFRVYQHSPPKMVKACDYILGEHLESLESNLQSFYRKYRVKEPKYLEETFCDKISRSCYEGQRKELRKEGIHPVGMDLDAANQALAAEGPSLVKMEPNEVESPTMTLERPPDHTTPNPSKNEL